MPTIPEAPHKGVLPEEHARPPCRGCVPEGQNGSNSLCDFKLMRIIDRDETWRSLSAWRCDLVR